MNDGRGHDLEPDQAALDELMRAFADEPDDDAADDEVFDELVIVEQSPVVDEWDQHLEPADELDDDDRGADDAGTGDTDTDGTDGTDTDGTDDTDTDDTDTDDTDTDDTDDTDTDDTDTDDSDTDDSDTDDTDTDDTDTDDTDTDGGAATPPEPPKKIIRIDDYGGSTEIVEPHDVAPGTATPSGQPPTAPLDAAGERIVIADEDAHPDAMYVDGSLDGDASRSIVFIEDDDTGDALKPESERDLRRGIEPRMRERRMAVKRAQGRKRLKWVALVVVLVLIVVAALAVLGSSLFAIRADEVTLTGIVYTDPDRLQEVIDDLVGTPVLLADTQAAERDLESIPWVDEARVRTDFPHAVSIEIREREAISTYQGPDQRFRVLDREGRVLDVLDGYPLAYLLLGGPDPVDLEPGEFAPRGYAAASELAKNLTGSVRLPNRVEIIEVAADGSRLVMRLNDGTEVRFGEARDLFAKLVRLETVLSSTESREPGVIDVSTSEVTL